MRDFGDHAPLEKLWQLRPKKQLAKSKAVCHIVLMSAAALLRRVRDYRLSRFFHSALKRQSKADKKARDKETRVAEQKVMQSTIPMFLV